MQMGEVGTQRLPGSDWPQRGGRPASSATQASTIMPGAVDEDLATALHPATRRMIESIVDDRVWALRGVEFTDFGSGVDLQVSRAKMRVQQMVGSVKLAAAEAADATDLCERLDAIMGLEEEVEQAIEAARDAGFRSLRHALVLVKHATHNTYAEDMTERQLRGLVEATDLLSADDPSEVPVEQVSDCLAATGLQSIPAVRDE